MLPCKREPKDLIVELCLVLEVALFVEVLHMLVCLSYHGDYKVEHDDVDEEDDEKPDCQDKIIGEWVRRLELLSKVTKRKLKDFNDEGEWLSNEVELASSFHCHWVPENSDGDGKVEVEDQQNNQEAAEARKHFEQHVDNEPNREEEPQEGEQSDASDEKKCNIKQPQN